jgi:apolipoprotein D and lipocalin family protein
MSYCAKKISSSIVVRLRYLAVMILLVGCTSVPEGVSPVNEFELSRYLGTWYEIARLDHPFERGLEQITATYTLRDDGGVEVLNKGYNPQKDEWQDALGKAYFVGDQQLGHLKVSFFGPFYASYVIFVLDKTDYQYAMITGPDRDYLWILARTPKIDAALLAQLVEQAKTLGYATDNLIYVKQ